MRDGVDESRQVAPISEGRPDLDLGEQVCERNVRFHTGDDTRDARLARGKRDLPGSGLSFGDLNYIEWPKYRDDPGYEGEQRCHEAFGSHKPAAPGRKSRRA